MSRPARALPMLALAVLAGALLIAPQAHAREVPTPTPTDAPTSNQLTAPCFQGKHGAAPPGWQQTGGWDVSMYKNPCGVKGTAGRINDPEQSGLSGPERDERIWQVVPGLGAYLVAEVQCVHHFAYYTDMHIYGGETPDGPWALVWTPFTLADCARDRWGATVPHAETELAAGHAYYKVEFAAMYATVQGGVKFTNAYFESR